MNIWERNQGYHVVTTITHALQNIAKELKRMNDREDQDKAKPGSAPLTSRYILIGSNDQDSLIELCAPTTQSEARALMLREYTETLQEQLSPFYLDQIQAKQMDRQSVEELERQAASTPFLQCSRTEDRAELGNGDRTQYWQVLALPGTQE